jgi:aspartokinase/homoserine dehydrogenase 1
MLVENIIKKESQNNRIIVVVSALHGVTDQLIKAAEAASHNNENYLQILKNLEEKHLDLIKDLIPFQNKVLGLVS